MGDARRLLLSFTLATVAATAGGCRGCTGIDDFALDDGATSTAHGGAVPATGTGSSPVGQGGGGAPGAGGDGPGPGTSSGGTGGDCEPCYSGPPGTEDRGTCRAGTQCGNDVCEGEILPLLVDDCFTDAREDCESGAGTACTAAPFAHGVITENQQFLFGLRVPIATDATGRVVGAAGYQDAVYFDGATLSAAQPSLVLWGLDADLQRTWQATRLAPADGSIAPRSMSMEGDDVVLSTYRIADGANVLDVERWVWGMPTPASTRSFLNPSVLFAATNATARRGGLTYIAFTHDGSADLDGDGAADGEPTKVLRSYVGALDDAGNDVWTIDPITGADVAVHSIVAVGEDLWLSGMTVAELDLGCSVPVPADSAFIAAVDLFTGDCRIAEPVASLAGLAQLEFSYSFIAGSERGIATLFPTLAVEVAFYDLDATEAWSTPLEPLFAPGALFSDPFGHIVVAGSITVDDLTPALARKLDRETGDPVWPADVMLGSTSYVQFTGGASRPDGGTVFGGSFVGDATLQGAAYTSSESPSSFYYAVSP